MSSRVFQSIVLQMKECTDRVIGVIDDQGTVVSCNQLTWIGEKWEALPPPEHQRRRRGDLWG